MDSIKRIMVEGSFFRRINKRFKGVARSLDLAAAEAPRKSYMNKIGIVPNRITIATYQGSYACNPKYICEALLKSGLDVEIIWLANSANIDKKENFPKEVKVVDTGTVEAFEALASSKVWIDNAFNCIWKAVPKKPEQVYIQTWHGSMGLKRIDADAVSDKYWNGRALDSGKLVSYCISDSSFETEVFRTTHWPDTPIKEFGHARNDILFSLDYKQLKEKVCKELGIIHYDRWTGEPLGSVSIDDIRLCMYAPTFREDRQTDCLGLDFDGLVKALEKRFGHKWIVLNRFHYKNRKEAAAGGNPLVVDATDYPDMQELMAAVDLGITDYSSWICDYVLTGRPGLIFATDLSSYKKERGFYYPLEETPFPIAETEEDLVNNILQFDEKKYEKQKEKFLKDRGCCEDGHACERIVQLIKEAIQEK